MCVRSSRDISKLSTFPDENEYIWIYSHEKGEAYAPKLYVTYETVGYRYIVYGPFYETGAVANCTASVTLFRQTESPYNFVLDGTDGDADNVTIETESQGWFFQWNVSFYNATRVYYLTDAFFEELWIFVTDPEQSFYVYSFTVTDFAGVTNAYLETIINMAGQNRVVEKFKLDLLGPVPFVMQWANRYDLRLICDQGCYTWGGFIALGEYSQNLVITRDMFPVAPPGTQVYVNATRMNSSWIQVKYSDAQTETSWVSVDIQYKQGLTWYSANVLYNETGNVHTYNWYGALAKTDYVVKVSALRNGSVKKWSFSCPKPAVTENPFDGLFEALGDWPIPASQIIGLFIVLAVFAIFSYAYMPLGCVLGVLTAMFLTYIGWLQISWGLLGLGMVIAVFVAISEGKKKEKEW